MSSLMQNFTNSENTFPQNNKLRQNKFIKLLHVKDGLHLSGGKVRNIGHMTMWIFMTLPSSGKKLHTVCLNIHVAVKMLISIEDNGAIWLVSLRFYSDFDIFLVTYWWCSYLTDFPGYLTVITNFSTNDLLWISSERQMAIK